LWPYVELKLRRANDRSTPHPPELRDHLSGFGYDDGTKERTGNMSDFNYLAPALLFAAQGRSGLRYRRFLNAADAQRQHGHHADRHNGHATEDACVCLGGA
jgi:hypothetical protein